MSKPFSQFLRHVIFIKILLRQNVIKNNKVFYSESASASIDSFTDNLVLEKGLKWHNLLKASDKPKIPSLKVDKTLDENLVCETKNKGSSLKLLIKLLNECANENNIPELVVNLQLCQNNNCCPTKEQLLFLTELLTVNKNKKGIQIIQQLCKVNYPLEYKIQSHYDHFMAEVMWFEGNVKESLDLFGMVYCNNVTLRRQVKIMLCNHFSEIITSHGEASRIIASNFVKMIADKYCDFSLMGYFWKVLFESEWFSDQQLSKNILKENHDLKYIIGWMLPTMGRQILEENKLDTFYRLVEVLLANDMKQHCDAMLRLLFDFKYNLGDLRGCTAIVKAYSDLELPFPKRQEKKFLHLLLKTKPKLERPLEYEFKF